MKTERIHPSLVHLVYPFAKKVGHLDREQLLDGSELISELAKCAPRDVFLDEANDEVFARHVYELIIYGEFVRSGRNVIAPAPRLATLLDKTDLDTVLVGDCPLPFRCFYIAFPESVTFPAPSGRPWIGAYIEHTEGVLQHVNIRLVTAPKYGSDDWYRHIPDSEDVVLDLSEPEATILEALQRAPEARLALEDIGFYGEAYDGFDKEVAKDADRALSSNSIRNALRLVFNTLCYLNNVEDGGTVSYPDDAPTDLIAAASTGSKSSRTKARGNLTAAGFIHIHVYGTHLPHEHRPTAEGDERHSPSAHWRRGHWRRQRHGPAWALTKTVWIRPTMVGGTPDADEAPTRIYHVEEPRAEK